MPHPTLTAQPFSADTPDYTPMIRRLKRRRGLVTALLILFTLIPLFLIGPTEIVLLGRELSFKGLSVGGVIAIICGGWLTGLILGAVVLLPVGNALVMEADPAKHLALQEGLFTFTATPVQKESVRCVSYLLMGRYAESGQSADILIRGGKTASLAAGLFCKGRAAFFAGDRETLTAVAAEYEMLAPRLKGTGYDKKRAMLALMDGILRGDGEAVSRLAPTVTSWEATRLPEAQVDYCRARAALLLMEQSEGEERKTYRYEAIHRLLSCKEKGGRSVLTSLAEEALASLPAETQDQGE